jgi:hypothetical protein
MAVRATMVDLITLVRTMINDTATTKQFTDQQIQDRLDAHRSDVRGEDLQASPVIVNAASTNNQAEFVFADFYSKFEYWEADAVLQGDLNGSPWKVLTPAASDYLTGHFQFQLTPFVNGTAPGQWPPVIITGKSYDPYAASADLLEFWAVKLAQKFDVVVGGQSFKRSQSPDNLRAMARMYRMQQKPKTVKMTRSDAMGSR